MSSQQRHPDKDADRAPPRSELPPGRSGAQPPDPAEVPIDPTAAPDAASPAPDPATDPATDPAGDAPPAAPAGPPGEAALAGLEAALAGVQAGLAGLTAAVEREHERAGHREGIIDRLHEDNQLLRRGELQALYEPVRAALFRLHDMVRREAVRWASPQPPEAVHAAPLLTAIADEIAEALGRTGVERFVVAPGSGFDPARHRPVGSEPVADPALDGTVTAALTDGFERAAEAGEQIVRRAEVRVGKLAAPGQFVPGPAAPGPANGTAERSGPGRKSGGQGHGRGRHAAG